jgi:hypothetical protein
MSGGDEADMTRIYLQKSSAVVLERRLLSLRVPDVARILDLESGSDLGRVRRRMGCGACGLCLSFAKGSSASFGAIRDPRVRGRGPGLRQGTGILTPPNGPQTHRIRDGSRGRGQAARGR